MDLNQEYTHDVEVRLRGVVWVIAVFFLLVLCRLFYLQVVRASYYQAFSENNSIRKIEIPAPRGIIFDRKARVLADNEPVFDLVVIPQYISDRMDLTFSLANLLGLHAEEIFDALKQASKMPPYRPFIIRSGISFDLVSKIKANKSPFQEAKPNLDGADIGYHYIRTYGEGDIASHILGYVREIDAEMLKKMDVKYPGKYKRGDFVGTGGIEQQYDLEIRGENGLVQKLVNAVGREVSSLDMNIALANEPLKAGSNVHLTLDTDVQRATKEAIGNNVGAIVVLDTRTGAVLAMYSNPTFDLNMLRSEDRSSYWSKILSDPDRPLYNRALQGVYPPASTFKVITAIAALQEQVVGREEKVHCNGGMKIGNRVYGCWLLSGHGPMDVVRALIHSCDVFFYTAGLRLGVDKIAEYAKKFGLGKRTGIEVSGEKDGFVPSNEWKMRVKNAEWNTGETASSSIGQGYNLVTPLQMAKVFAEIANGGYKITPHLVEKILSSDGNLLYEWMTTPEPIEGVSKETIDIVKQGLYGVVNGPGGTATALSTLQLKIAGKTGTAQVVSKESGKTGGKYKNHAWFVGYAPYDDPEIVVSVIIEHGGHGGGVAGPIAGEVIKEYFRSKDVADNN